MKLIFNPKSFAVFIAIFIVEVLIALFVNDSIIRPYGGDVLVVIMMYYFFRSFIHTKPVYLVAGVLLFAYAVEFTQHLNLIDILGVRDNKVLTIILGSSFSWLDIIAYTIGGLICYFIGKIHQ